MTTPEFVLERPEHWQQLYQRVLDQVLVQRSDMRVIVEKQARQSLNASEDTKLHTFDRLVFLPKLAKEGVSMFAQRLGRAELPAHFERLDLPDWHSGKGRAVTPYRPVSEFGNELEPNQRLVVLGEMRGLLETATRNIIASGKAEVHWIHSSLHILSGIGFRASQIEEHIRQHHGISK